jgi:hypothetical protein
MCPVGEIGRHACLRNRCREKRTGSSPVWGTRFTIAAENGYSIVSHKHDSVGSTPIPATKLEGDYVDLGWKIQSIKAES